jgi:2-polyprenyl-6-methoxyphenol hydroxylase-like FAD-dependent oxidoreductase
VTKATDCDVLVVGAGPTGLMAANLLARSGVSVRIIERRTEATRESRAFAVQARTLELMQSIGLADNLIAKGMKADSVNIHIKGKFRGGLNFNLVDAPDTPFKYILLVPQSETEAALATDVETLGVAIERGKEVLNIAQDATGVTTRVRAQDGIESDIRSAYIIGADGSRSVVRTASGIAWDGDILPQRFLLADCKVDWPLDHEHFRVFLNGPLIGLFLPLDGKRTSRVMATDLSGSFDDGDASVPAPLDLAEMQAGLSAAINMPVKLSEPIWVTRYRAHHRFVDRYREGRAFVAGDAAHIHSPAGGQGMNTGLQDAANLAWKIAAVLRGADDGLLDTYDSERRPVGENVVKSTGKLFNAAAGQSAAKAAIRDRVLPFALKIISRARPIQRKAFLGTSQRNIAYATGSIAVASDVGNWSKGPKPGRRAPNAQVSITSDIFSLIAKYTVNVLCFSRTPLSDQERSRADAFGAHIIGPGAHADAFARYGVDAKMDQGLYVVRPDGYIGWRANVLDFDRCKAFIDTLK